MHGTFQDCAAYSSPLEAKLTYTRKLIASLHDPETGFSGADLLARVDATGVEHVAADKEQNCLTCYVPFHRKKTPSFRNQISYQLEAPSDQDDGTFCERSPQRIAGAWIHEVMHAQSWSLAPELHASGYNANTPVVLCPEDYVAMMCITERVAFAYSGWMMSLAQRQDPSFGEFVTPVNGDMFDYLRSRNTGIHQTLVDAGELSMRTFWARDKRDGHPLTMEQYYQWLALSNYEFITKACLEDERLPLVVRLEPHNFVSIAQSFGPNILSGGNFTVPPLRALDQAWLDDIYSLLHKGASVPRREHLPTFDSALMSFGHTPEGFLAMSKGQGARGDAAALPSRVPAFITGSAPSKPANLIIA